MLNLNFQNGQAPALNARNMNAIVESINTLGYAVGGPNVASTVSEMTDTSKVYVYTGSETGYTAGNWYYYNGSAWVSGGVYQAVAVETDTTLTMPGVAADAKATGDAVSELKNDLKYNNSHDILYDKFIGASGNDKGVTFTFSGKNECTLTGTATGIAAKNILNFTISQIPLEIGQKLYVKISGANSSVFLRLFFMNGSSILSNNKINTSKALIIPTDCTGIIARLEVNSGQTVDNTLNFHILTAQTNMDLDEAIESLAGDAIAIKNVIERNTDFDRLTSQGIWFASTDNNYTNYPYESAYSAWLVVFKANSLLQQLVIPYFFSSTAPALSLSVMRRNYNGTSWSTWQPFNSEDNYGEYYAFGDSLTKGSLNVSHAAPDVVYPTLVGKVCNLNVHNMGIGGQGLVMNQGADTEDLGYDTVRNTDISNAKLITLAWGTNDTPSPNLGTASDASGINTVCGQMKAILDYITTNNPTCQIIIICMPRSSLGFDDNGAGGWSRNDFQNMMELIGESYCVPVVSYKGCTICNNNNWMAVTTSADRVHPTNAGYYITSAYIAGMVSKYFHA